MRIKTICAWCNKTLPSREYPFAPDLGNKEPVNHGICDECCKEALNEIASGLAEAKPIGGKKKRARAQTRHKLK
jgi:hypothetical protein